MNRNRRILIVEDNMMIAEYVASVLEADGFVPVHAASLARARDHLSRDDLIDLCLSDRWLPDGEATTLMSDLHGIPAIAMSAQLEPEDRARLVAAGFSATLLKPCSPDDLIAAIQAALSDPGHDRHTQGNASASDAGTTVLDDDAALRMCGGDRDVMARLRRLLAAELPPFHASLLAASDDPERLPSLAGELHKLAASAGWCGASELAHHCDQLRCALDTNEESGIWTAHRHLLAALERLEQALVDAGTE